MQKTMAWAFVGRLTIVVHGPRNPTAHEWERFLTETIARRSEAWGKDPRSGARGAVARVLVVSYGGVPDGDQRKKLTATIERNAAPTVVMTDSALMLGVSRVLAFFNPTQKTVPLAAEREALDFLDLGADERATARQLRAKLESELEIRTEEAAPR